MPRDMCSRSEAPPPEASAVAIDPRRMEDEPVGIRAGAGLVGWRRVGARLGFGREAKKVRCFNLILIY
jgi:hypothetical protein